MKLPYFDKAGRIHHIVYIGSAISVGENGYSRISVIATPSTIQRLNSLADRGYGNRPNESAPGVIYRSPKHFRMAVLKTQKMAIGWKLNAIAHRWGLKRA